MPVLLRPATADDVAQLLAFIRALAACEKLLPAVEATGEKLRATLFPAAGHPAAECVLAFFVLRRAPDWSGLIRHAEPTAE